MLALVAAPPWVASATSAAAETQGTRLPLIFLVLAFWRLMTMLPMGAGAAPVLVRVMLPVTLRTLGGWAWPLTTAIVQTTVPEPLARPLVSAELVMDQAVLPASQREAVHLSKEILVWVCMAGAGMAKKRNKAAS